MRLLLTPTVYRLNETSLHRGGPGIPDRWLSESPAPKLKAAVAVGKEQEMSRGRKKHSPAGFQGQGSSGGAEGQEMVALPAARYEVHPRQIQAWKKALTEGASGVFGNGKDQKSWDDAALIARQ